MVLDARLVMMDSGNLGNEYIGASRLAFQGDLMLTLENRLFCLFKKVVVYGVEVL